MTKEVPISEAARRLGLDYQQCRARLLRGDLAGGRDPFGRLFVNESSIGTALSTRATARERRTTSSERRKASLRSDA